MKSENIESVIKLFGGVRAFAKIIERSPSVVCRWQFKREASAGRGNNGIPKKLRPIIIAKAKELGVKLKEKDLEF